MINKRFLPRGAGPSRKRRPQDSSTDSHSKAGLHFKQAYGLAAAEGEKLLLTTEGCEQQKPWMLLGSEAEGMEKEGLGQVQVGSP